MHTARKDLAIVAADELRLMVEIAAWSAVGFSMGWRPELVDGEDHGPYGGAQKHQERDAEKVKRLRFLGFRPRTILQGATPNRSVPPSEVPPSS